MVQLGDQIDRVRPSNLINNICSDDDPELYQDEGSDLKIISLFNKLHTQAVQYGGACISVLGNHEMMNVEGDLDMYPLVNFGNSVIFLKQINL